MKLTLKESSKQDLSLSVVPGETLLTALRGAGLPINAACDGRGTCGKCRVRVLGGGAGPVSEGERRFLSEKDLADGVRLACFVRPEADLEVQLFDAQEKGHPILTDGFVPDFVFDPPLRRESIVLEPASLEAPLSLDERLAGAAGLEEVPLAVLRRLPSEETRFSVLTHDGEFLTAEPEGKDGEEGVFAAAVDIGTTTVVVSLIDMGTGRELGSASDVNPQKEHGQDVLTRITWVQEVGMEAVLQMQREIVLKLEELLLSICGKRAVPPRRVFQLSVGANATMTHLLLGADPRSIGLSPYAPQLRRARYERASDLGFTRIHPDARVLCLPQISSFVGGDIVAGIVTADLTEAKDNVLFIDIGTNGEMVLSRKGELFAASCAAGPALEGMNISCGMRAQEGAVEEAALKDGRLSLTAIGGREPIGLCGSGILAVVREFLAAGLITSRGNIARAEEAPPELRHLIGASEGKRSLVLREGDTPLVLTQKDVRQIQLAKGAILSGALCLIEAAGLTPDTMDRVVIAGQFGKHLAPESLVGAGLLPASFGDRIHYIGNSSRTGAYLSLVSREHHRRMTQGIREVRYIELSVRPGYERTFAEALLFR